MPKYVALDLVFGDTLSVARAATLETQVDLARGRHFPLGGRSGVGTTATTYEDVPGAAVARLDMNVTAKLRATAYVSGGTGYMQVYDLTRDEVVAGSEKTFVNTSAALVELEAELELLAGDYKLQVKVNADTNHVVVHQAALVTL